MDSSSKCNIKRCSASIVVHFMWHFQPSLHTQRPRDKPVQAHKSQSPADLDTCNGFRANHAPRWDGDGGAELPGGICQRRDSRHRGLADVTRSGLICEHGLSNTRAVRRSYPVLRHTNIGNRHHKICEN